MSSPDSAGESNDEAATHRLPPIMDVRKLTAAQILSYLDAIEQETQGDPALLPQALLRYNLTRARYEEFSMCRPDLTYAAEHNDNVWAGRNGRLHAPLPKGTANASHAPRSPAEMTATPDPVTAHEEISEEESRSNIVQKQHLRTPKEQRETFFRVQRLVEQSHLALAAACRQACISVPRYYVYKRRYGKGAKEVDATGRPIVKQEAPAQELRLDRLAKRALLHLPLWGPEDEE